MIYAAVLIPLIFIFVFTAVICKRPFSDEFKKNQKKYPICFLVMAATVLIINIYQTSNFAFAELRWWAEKCSALFFTIKMLFIAFMYIFSIFRVLVYRNICNEINNGRDIAEITASDIPAWMAEFKAGDDKDTRSFGQRVRVLIAPMAVFTYMFFVFGVLEPYFANLNEWHFKLWDILPPMAGAVLVSVGLLLLCAYKIKGRKLDVLAGVLTMISAAAFIQNSFFNSYSFITGLSFTVSDTEVFLNNILWIALILVPFFIKPKHEKVLTNGAVFLSLGLLFIQAAPLPYMLIDGIPRIDDTEHVQYDLDGSRQFEISTQGNTMVFIMDSFYMGDFKAYLKNNPECYDVLSDFVFFDNISTETFSTATSMPCLLTATDTDVSVGYIEANAKCWQSENAEYFYGSLKDNNYSVRLYTDGDQYCGGAENMLGKIDNAVMSYKAEYDVKKIPTYFSMMKLSLYRYLPDAVKALFVVSDSSDINRYSYDTSIYYTDDSDWLSVTDSAHERGIEFYNFDYYQRMKSGFTPVSDKKLCVFQHLSGMHNPYCSETKKNATYDEALDGCMEILLEYVRQLKEMDVYDKSTIILTADHGVPYINQSSPVMLIKPAGRTGDKLAINTAPGILQWELLPTILDCEGLEHSSLGKSYFELDENMERVRICKALAREDDLPPVPKCGSVGVSTWNAFEVYSYTGRVEEVDTENDPYTVVPITDYWF